MKINYKEIVKPTAVLTVICLVTVALLAIINIFTGPIIADRQAGAANAALLEVYPDGTFGADSQIKDFSSYNLPKEITAVYKEANGGYVFQATVNGYKPGLVIMCGVDPDGKITGTKVIVTNETPDIAASVFDKTDKEGFFIGATIEEIPDLVASVTPGYTAKGYSDAVKASLDAFTVIGGGRTPEQIFADNCNTALGTEGKTFSEWYASAMLTGVNGFYLTDGGAVVVVGEVFVGINENGEVVGASSAKSEAITPDADTAAIATAAWTAYTESIVALGELELTKAQKNTVIGACCDAEGNYYLELKATGYQAGFEYGSGDYIYITLVISADGKIASLETTSHKETKGIETQDKLNAYDESFTGKGKDDIKVTIASPDSHGAPQIPEGCTDVGAISGATFTSTGYQKAVKTAFEVFEILTGGASND